MGAQIIAGAIAVTAGGGVSFVDKGWPLAALVAVAQSCCTKSRPTPRPLRSSSGDGRSRDRHRGNTVPRQLIGQTRKLCCSGLVVNLHHEKH